MLLAALNRQKLLHFILRQVDQITAQLPFKSGAPLLDILLAALIFKPCADLAACLAGLDDIQPVAARSVSLHRGSQHLNDLAGFDTIIQRHDPAVHLCADHAVADGGMDGIGEVDHGAAARQCDDVALRRQGKHLIRGQIRFDGADNILCVLDVLLILDKLAHPSEPLLQTILLLESQLVFPVRRDAVFGGIMHLPGADLHLKGDLLLADHGRVQRLIHVRLRGGDIILEAVRDRAEHLVDDAEYVIAVVHRIHNDPHCINIVDLVERVPLHIHFAVYARDALDPAGQKRLESVFAELFPQTVLNILQKCLALALAQRQRLFDLLIRHRVEDAQRQILKLLLDGADTESVRKRRIDIHGLLRLVAALLRLPARTCTHVVQAVGELDDDDADILCHGEQHFADIFRLLLLTGGKRQLVELGHAVHQTGDLGAERLADIRQLHRRILHHIMEQRRHNGVGIHAHFHQNQRDAERVADIFLTRGAALSVVGAARRLHSAVDRQQVIWLITFDDRLFERGDQIFFLDHSDSSPLFR